MRPNTLFHVRQAGRIYLDFNGCYSLRNFGMHFYRFENKKRIFSMDADQTIDTVEMAKGNHK